MVGLSGLIRPIVPFVGERPCQRCSLFAASPGLVGLALLDVDVIGEDMLAAEDAVQSFAELPAA